MLWQPEVEKEKSIQCINLCKLLSRQKLLHRGSHNYLNEAKYAQVWWKNFLWSSVALILIFEQAHSDLREINDTSHCLSSYFDIKNNL